MGIAKVLGVAVASALLAGAAAPARAQGLNIAVIDVNRVLNESEAGKVAKKKVEDRYQELKKQIDAKQGEARKMKEEIEKQKILMGKEKLREKEEALGAKVAELQQMAAKSEKEMQTRQNELTREILKVVEVQVDKAVADGKIDLLLDKSAGVIHNTPSLDITDKVLEMVNKNGGGGGKAGNGEKSKGGTGGKK
jgi:outer membrane protein